MNKFSFDPFQYASCRPNYPDSLFQYLKEISSCEAVLECGAGSGQAAQSLSRYFKHIIALDISFELLSQASISPNVYYVESSAEQLPINSSSIKLICVAQAIHWFELKDFYDEVKRTLKPDGVIAAWCYNQTVINPVIDRIIKKVFLTVSGGENPSIARQYLYNHYKTMPFPFQHIPTPNFEIKMNWNLMQWLSYMHTWPSILEYEKKYSINPISSIMEELAYVWGNPLSKKLITWPIYLRVGKKN